MNFPLTKLISARDLQALLQQGDDIVLLDVLPPESFEVEHLPGARNACIYQTDFLEIARPLIATDDQLVVVYDVDASSLASATAADRLASAGYKRVIDFNGGLAEWREAELPVEGTGTATTKKPTLNRKLAVDPSQSLLEWTGRNLANRHHGTINVSGGHIDILDGEAVGGEIEIDLTSIKSTDLADPKLERMLAGHLMSPDFFDSEKHPRGVFKLTAINPVEASNPGLPNHSVSGTLTLKGIEHPVEFLAAIGETAEGDVIAQASFEIDRTKWNVLYGSGKFFARLGKHLVNDLVSIHLKITAR